ncbi:MAG: 50S ribosomal protein L3 [Roseibacillus sp.]|nr:50S ribosomal protein L3 [Roseibacillus sp.]
MSLGLIGKKIGMTRHFDQEAGNAITVTVIDVSGNEFVQRKTTDSKDGYAAVQVAYSDQKEQRMKQPAMGHLKKHGVAAKRVIREFRLEEGEELPESHPGAELFQDGQWVDVIGTTKGKGFQGVVKRYNFGGGPDSHGHMTHRRPGAVGAGTWPGRIWKNQRMPGHEGQRRRTTQNLKIVQVRPEDNVILVSGSVPGSKGSYVIVRPAKKKPAPAAAE